MELILNRNELIDLIETAIAERFVGPWKIKNAWEVTGCVTVVLADERYFAEQDRMKRMLREVAPSCNEAAAA